MAIYIDVIIIHNSLGLIDLLLGVNSKVLRTESELSITYNSPLKLFFFKSIFFFPQINF